MSLKDRLLRESIKQIKEYLGVTNDYEEKSIYLKKDDDLIGLHATLIGTETGLMQIEGWVNAYSNDYKYLGSIYRLFGPIEQEADKLKKDGWVEVPPPPEDPLPEAA